MREIKFRVWDKVLSQWCVYKPHPEHHLHLYYSTRDDGVTGNSELQYCIESDDFDVEQFTGLKDKNGKDVYEGDCFERNGHKGVVEQAESGLWIVTFDDRKIIALMCDQEWIWRCDEHEIIGNITEKPELLNKETT